MALAQVRVSEYNQLKAQVNAASRKQTGNLAVRDLSGVVHKCATGRADIFRLRMSEVLGCGGLFARSVLGRIHLQSSLHFGRQDAFWVVSRPRRVDARSYS